MVQISFVGLVQTAHSVILGVGVYDYLILHFGDRDNLETAEWNFVAHWGVCAFVALYALFPPTRLCPNPQRPDADTSSHTNCRLVQLYYAFRIQQTMFGIKRILVSSLVVVFALAQAAFASLAAYSTSRLPSSEDVYRLEIKDDLGWQTLAMLISSMIGNVVICYAMMVEHRNPRYTVRSETVLGVTKRLTLEV